MADSQHNRTSPPTGVWDNQSDVAGHAPGDCVGPYRLVESIGEGGMGTVWRAEQTDPVRRSVALKLIKAGMDTRQVLGRFDAERQALAMMDHPNIAKVHDGGCTPNGRPYFVMELVPGAPITKYCDGERLGIRERLALFIPVCQAVQHAHQKGIIHRDLKPSNVLIGLYDGKAVPKVIDFGVAKTTLSKLTDATMYTDVGAILGTPEYMAPEQAESNNLDIDTRADIYSLGVILYELLTGSPPFSRKKLLNAGFEEILRMIREVEPPSPSTKLSASDELPSLAAVRQLEPKRLTRTIRGELDWLVMKCLEKDRGRRYETANGLAMDVQRYLSDEPVLAGPVSAGYRMKKFVRRNKGPVIAAAVVAATLFGGIAGTTWQWQRAIHERDDKETARQAEAKERGRAQDAESDTKAFGDFLTVRVLAAARPQDVEGGLGFDVTVARALEEAEKHIAEDFAGRPKAEATTRQALGETWRHLTSDAYHRAEAHLLSAAF